MSFLSTCQMSKQFAEAEYPIIYYHLLRIVLQVVKGKAPDLQLNV